MLRQLVDLLNFSLAGVPSALPIHLQADFMVVHVKVATSLALIVNELVEYTLAHSEVNNVISNSEMQENREPLMPLPLVSSVSSQRASASQDSSSGESSQESETANAILIQLRHDSATTLLTVENPGPGFAPDFDVYDCQ